MSMGGNEDDDAVGVRPRSEAARQAWKQANEDMAAIAEDRRADGWSVTSMPAVHTSPVGKSTGDDEDRFGLVHVIPDNHADAFVEAFERGDYPDYHVYRNEVQGDVFLVTELLDPEAESVILIAASYDLQKATALLRSVHEEDAIHTYAKTVDGTELGSVRHDEFEPFVPEGFHELPEEFDG